MAEEQKSTIYNVRVTAEDALKTLAELKLRSQELRDQQKALGKVTEENAQEYYALDNQIKAINSEANKYQKQIQNNIKLQNQQEASLAKLRTQLALDNAEFAELGNSMKDAARKAELGKRIAETTEELKAQEEALGDYRRSVGNYEKATDNLKQELNDLTDTLIRMAQAGDTSSASFKEMVKRAGELKAAEDTVNTAIDQTGRGIDTLVAVTDATSAITSVYGLWTTATQVLGSENEELNAIMTKMITIITALSSLSSLQAALSKTEATYRAASNLVQLVGINQTLAETKAIAAKNAVQGTGNILTKAAAAATWLWNAALAANPVVLVAAAVGGLMAGVVALTNAFNSNTETQERATRAMEAYNRAAEASTYVLDQIETKRNTLSKAEEIRGKREIENLKANHATSEQIAEAQLKTANKLREIEMSAARQRQMAAMDEFDSLKKVIAAKEEELNTWSGSLNKYKKAKKELDDLKGRYQELFRTIENEGAAVANLALETAIANREAQQSIADKALEAQQSIADKALEVALKNSEAMQKIREDDLRFQTTFQSTSIAIRMEYERKLYKAAQDGARERLALQKAHGKITNKEYQTALNAMARSDKQFYENQAKQLNDYLAGVRANILAVASGGTVDMQIAQVTQKYQDAMKELANIQSPQFVRGMSEEEYQKEYAAYEQFLVNRAELEKQIQQNLQDEIKKIREDATKQQLDRFNQVLNEQYAEDLSKAADNERKKLELENEMIQKQIEARKAAGEKTYEQEAQLRANNLRLQQMDLDKELTQAELNHKSKYEIRKRYLEAELAAAQGNEDAIAQIQLEMAENEESLWEERIEKLQEYAGIASSFATAFNDLASALGERRAQEVEEQYSREEQALANMYANGQITEAQYNEKKIKMEKQKEKELAKIKREQAIRERAMGSFEIGINTAISIMASAKMGFPLAIPFIAAAAALGAVQMAALWAAPLPKAARGKYIEGPSHAAGGVHIEAEGGETIINKKSSRMFLPLLSAINELGGGVPFTKVGSDGGYAIRSFAEASEPMNRLDMERAIQKAFGQVRVIATIEDIRREDANYVQIQGRANF
jgi:hypothetical protein